VSIMIIGLTGGIASGKSTVSKYLAEKGFKVYDADKIAKDISEKKSVQEEIILTFGNKILDKNENIDYWCSRIYWITIGISSLERKT